MRLHKNRNYWVNTFLNKIITFNFIKAIQIVTFFFCLVYYSLPLIPIRSQVRHPLTICRLFSTWSLHGLPCDLLYLGEFFEDPLSRRIPSLYSTCHNQLKISVSVIYEYVGLRRDRSTLPFSWFPSGCFLTQILLRIILSNVTRAFAFLVSKPVFRRTYKFRLNYSFVLFLVAPNKMLDLIILFKL